MGFRPNKNAISLVVGVIYMVTFNNEPGNYRLASGRTCTLLLGGFASRGNRLVGIFLKKIIH